MSKVVSLRLKDDQVRRLERLARRLDRTPSEAAARLLEEALRREEFAFVEFRDSPAGRQAYVTGSSLAVWEVIWLLRHYAGDVKAVAEHLQWPEVKVMAAVRYSDAYRDEIEAAIEDNNWNLDDIHNAIPAMKVIGAGTR